MQRKIGVCVSINRINYFSPAAVTNPSMMIYSGSAPFEAQSIIEGMKYNKRPMSFCVFLKSKHKAICEELPPYSQVCVNIRHCSNFINRHCTSGAGVLQSQSQAFLREQIDFNFNKYCCYNAVRDGQTKPIKC